MSLSLKKTVFISFFLILSCFLGLFFYLFERDWVDISSLECFSPAQPSIIYDINNKEIGRFELDRCAPVKYENLPKSLINAVIAAEDHNFFNHIGISLRGIVRSMLINIYRRKFAQGASTITQQLARGMFLSRRRKFSRKIQEIFLSFQLERHFTKKQILELYLNNIDFGRGIYGVETACRRFWNKSIQKISIDEAAVLAAVTRSATIY